MLVSLTLAVEAISLSHTSARNLSSFATVHMDIHYMRYHQRLGSCSPSIDKAQLQVFLACCSVGNLLFLSCYAAIISNRVQFRLIFNT